MSTYFRSADAVPSGRPIWASHMDSVCTAPQCLNCVDTVVKSRPPWTPLDHDHCNHWIPLLATFDIPPLILMTLCWKIKNHYYTTPSDHDHCYLRTPLLATWYYLIPGFDLPVTLCAPACGSPPATQTPSACLPPPSPPSGMPNPTPATCHPSLSLSSGFCRTPVYTTTTTTRLTTTTIIIATDNPSPPSPTFYSWWILIARMFLFVSNLLATKI